MSNVAHKFDTSKPIQSGGTVQTCYGNKTVAVLPVGTGLSMENRSGDRTPDLRGTIRGYGYHDPDGCGGQILPCYKIQFKDGEVNFVAIEDIPVPGGYWKVLS